MPVLTCASLLATAAAADSTAIVVVFAAMGEVPLLALPMDDDATAPVDDAGLRVPVVRVAAAVLPIATAAKSPGDMSEAEVVAVCAVPAPLALLCWLRASLRTRCTVDRAGSTLGDGRLSASLPMVLHGLAGAGVAISGGGSRSPEPLLLLLLFPC